MIRVLIELFPNEVQFLPAADDYISFVTFFMLACGLAFQLPTLLVILVRLRILNSRILRTPTTHRVFSAVRVCGDHHAGLRSHCRAADRDGAADHLVRDQYFCGNKN